jgi:hypothetical protein
VGVLLLFVTRVRAMRYVGAIMAVGSARSRPRPNGPVGATSPARTRSLTTDCSERLASTAFAPGPYRIAG